MAQPKPSKPKKNKTLACFIVEKYVKKEKVSWSRDLKIAYILIDLAPDFPFWKQLDKKFDLDSLVQFNTDKCKFFLTKSYKEWQDKEKLKLTYQPEVFRKFEVDTGEEPVKVENIIKKPKSMLDFCK